MGILDVIVIHYFKSMVKAYCRFYLKILGVFTIGTHIFRQSRAHPGTVASASCKAFSSFSVSNSGGAGTRRNMSSVKTS